MLSFGSVARRLAAVVVFGIMTSNQVGVGLAKSPHIDFRALYHAANLSNQAYDPKSKIMREMSGASVWVATPGKTQVQYFIIFNDRHRSQTISVRGTDNKTNWALDKDFLAVRDQKTGILIHRGFRNAALTLYSDVRPRLRKGYTTYLTGHSLGGAVAAILGIYLQHDDVRIGGIYTFGQPKFTNAAGASAHERLPLLRVIHQNDTVALLPDNDGHGDQLFAHLGPAINILPGPYYVYGTARQTLKFSQGSFNNWLVQISVPDHKMKWYLQRLKDKLDGSTEVSFEDRNKYVVRHKYGSGTDTAPVKRQYNFNHHN